MDRMEWNGKEFLDLIRKDPVSSQILSCVIENGVMPQGLFLKGKNGTKVSHSLRLLQEKRILESLETPAGTVIVLSSDSYLLSRRSAFGETPGRRSHRYPERWLGDFALKDLRSLSCALGRGRFLREWRGGAWEEVIGFQARESKIWIPEEGASFGALKISPSEKKSPDILWVLFDPKEERNDEDDERRRAWIRERENGDLVVLLRENDDGTWELV